jgi:hypothetical protein
MKEPLAGTAGRSKRRAFDNFCAHGMTEQMGSEMGEHRGLTEEVTSWVTSLQDSVWAR